MKDGRERFKELIETILHGMPRAEVRDELASLIAKDGELLREYVAQMRMHALLKWRSGRTEMMQAPQPCAPGRVIDFPTEPAGPHQAARWMGLAAAVLILCGLTSAWFRISPRLHAEIAVLEAVDASWSDGRAITAGDRITQTMLDFASGRVRFSTSAGVLMSVTAPARLEVVDSMRVRVLSGRVTADVPEHAHGFTVETAWARVVDLGTRFGVEAGEDGRTSVVVFEGKVDVARDGTPGKSDSRKGRPCGSKMAKRLCASKMYSAARIPMNGSCARAPD